MGDAEFYLRSRGRISGPFDRATVHKMVLRGLASRVDEISANHCNWRPLADFLREESVSTSPVTSNETNRPSSGTGYYYAQDSINVGPVPGELLIRLVKLGKIRSDAVIWTDATNHTRASDVDWLAPFLPVASRDDSPPDQASHGANPILSIVIASFVLVFVAALIGFVLTEKDATLSSRPQPINTVQAAIGPQKDARVLPTTSASTKQSLIIAAPASIFDPKTVKGPEDDEAISNAVGLVVAGFEFSIPEINGGRRTQLPFVTGSSFTVSPDSEMLTNKHVVEMIEKVRNDQSLRRFVQSRLGEDMQPTIWVFVAGSEHVAQVRYVSSEYDLAVLKVSGIPPVSFRLSDASKAARGQDVYALGFPGIASQALSVDELTQESLAQLSHEPELRSNFKERDFQFTLTKGAVSRVVDEANGHRWIQHEAVVRHGNSGGPLVDAHGLVMGINTRIQTNGEGDVQTNMSAEISQMRREIEENTTGTIWVSPN